MANNYSSAASVASMNDELDFIDPSMVMKMGLPNDMPPHIVYFQTIWETSNDPEGFYEGLKMNLGIVQGSEPPPVWEKHNREMDLINQLGLTTLMSNYFGTPFIFYRDNLALSFHPGQITACTSAGDKPYVNQFDLYIYQHKECFKHFKEFVVLRSDRKEIKQPLRDLCNKAKEHGCIKHISGGNFFNGIFSGSMIFKSKKSKSNPKANTGFKVLTFDPKLFPSSKDMFDYEVMTPIEYVPKKEIKLFPQFQISLSNRSPAVDPIKRYFGPSKSPIRHKNCMAKLKMEENKQINFDNHQEGIFMVTGMTVRLDLTTGNLYISFPNIESYVQTNVNECNDKMEDDY